MTSWPQYYTKDNGWGHNAPCEIFLSTINMNRLILILNCPTKQLNPRMHNYPIYYLCTFFWILIFCYPASNIRIEKYQYPKEYTKIVDWIIMHAGIKLFCRKIQNKCTTVYFKWRQEDFTRCSCRLPSVSPSVIFGIILWPTCHVFRNCGEFL